MGKLTLPEHLQLLLTGEPVLDIYAAGPWRVPDDLADEMWERGRDLDASPEARSLRPRGGLPDYWAAGVTAAGADLCILTSYLCGVSAVRGGSHDEPELEFFGRFRRDPPHLDRDPEQWIAYGARWRPPGGWMFSDPERRQAAYALTLRSVQILEGITPFEARRQALLSLLQRAGPSGPAPALLTGNLEQMEVGWAASASQDELAVLPELAGPVGYLSWAYDGLAAAHLRLAHLVSGTAPLPQAIAHLVLQSGLRDPPGALAAAAGTGGYLEVQERVQAAAGFRPSEWSQQTSAWLARALAAGEIGTCRAVRVLLRRELLLAEPAPLLAVRLRRPDCPRLEPDCAVGLHQPEHLA